MFDRQPYYGLKVNVVLQCMYVRMSTKLSTQKNIVYWHMNNFVKIIILTLNLQLLYFTKTFLQFYVLTYFLKKIVDCFRRY